MPKTMKLTGNTSEMLRHYVGNRKKGHIFINVRTGKRLTLRLLEKMIDKWARLLNIQKLQFIKPSGREYHLITIMGLREAGERHMICSGGDPDVSAKAVHFSRKRTLLLVQKWGNISLKKIWDYNLKNNLIFSFKQFK